MLEATEVRLKTSTKAEEVIHAPSVLSLGSRGFPGSRGLPSSEQRTLETPLTDANLPDVALCREV